MPIVPLWGPGAGYKSSNVSSQRRINFYSTPQSDQDKSPLVLYGTPGLTLFADFGDSPCRGARTVAGTTYAVFGYNIYAVSPSGSYTTVGLGLTGNSGHVSMADNGTQLLIVDGTFGYCYNISSGLFTVLFAGLFPAQGANSCCFLDGYFIVNKPGTGRFYWSAVYDGTTWDSLQFATAESNPDNLIAVSSDHGELILYGEQTTEFWSGSGDASIFRRVGGAGVEWGTPAPWSIARYGDQEIFLAKNRMGQFQVVTMLEFTVTPVSTPEIDHDLNSRGNIGAATAYSYLLDGQRFYQINFPDKSYLYDGYGWNEVQSGGGRHYGENRFEINAVPYVTDYRNGKIYKVDANNYSDNGDVIVRELTSKHVFHDYDRLTVWSLQLDVEPGVGLNSGQGSDPKIMLQISKDGGHTWGNERWAGLGKMGHYLHRVIWYQLGLARDFVFRWRITDPVKVVIMGCSITVQ